jgi:hypothetical protein
MRVQFQASGGVGFFPGLAAPRTIDVDALGPDELRSLRQLLHEARFFELPARQAVPRGAADYRTYQITVEDEGRRHTVTVSDPVIEPSLQKLVNRLRALAAPAPRGPA